MNLSCNIPSPVPGKYNCEFDFAPFGVVRVVDGMVLGVSDECAAALVALGYYARVESLFEPAAPLLWGRIRPSLPRLVSTLINAPPLRLGGKSASNC